MLLIDIIKDLENIDDDLTICVARSPDWSAISEAELVPNHKVRELATFPYFLEVFMAKHVLTAWSAVRDREPDLAQRCQAIIHYAEYDAYFFDDL